MNSLIDFVLPRVVFRVIDGIVVLFVNYRIHFTFQFLIENLCQSN